MDEETPNQQYIIDLFGENRQEQKNIMIEIIREFHSDKKEFTYLYKKAEYLEASKVVHRLNQKISIFGLEKSHANAQKFENELRENVLTSFKKFNETLLTIERYLENYEKYNC